MQDNIEKVVLTFNCPECDELYWGFLSNELKWYETLGEVDQKRFLRRQLNKHLEICYAARRN